MRLLDSKKGQMRNYLVPIIALFLLGFFSIFSMTLLLYLIDGFDDAGYYTGKLAEAGQGFIRGMAVFDYVIVIMMVIFIIGIGVTSYKLNTPAIFFVVSLVLSSAYGFVAYFFSYLFSQMVSPGVFALARFYFPRTLIICTNLHWVALAVFIVGSITLFGKKERGQFVSE